MRRDWTDEPDYKRWENHVKGELIPMIRGSVISMSLVPPEGEHDVKYAVELGLSILMGKPIILIVMPGRPVPPKLRAVADDVIEADLSDPRSSAELAERIERIVKAVGEESHP